MTDVTRQLHNTATVCQRHFAEAHYRQSNFKTPKILAPNLWIEGAIALETPVSSAILWFETGVSSPFPFPNWSLGTSCNEALFAVEYRQSYTARKIS